jgi:mono/diheme cytochrome c family protein
MRKLVIITTFVVLILAACSPEDTEFQYSDLPPGDAVRGEELFSESVNGAPACSNCHTVTGGEGAGPTLQNYAEVAGGRVDDQNAEEYTFYATLRPSRHLVQGFSNVMPSNYEEKLSQQEIADIIAYMLTLGGDGSAAAQVSEEGDDSVDLYIIIVRLIHILGAVVWLGSGFFTIAFLQPALSGSGMEGQRFMQSFFKNTKFEIAMPLSGLITVVAGLMLYYRVSDGFNSDWMGSTPGIVLSIGSLAGIVAFLHGAAAIGPITRQMTALMKEIEGQGTPPTDEQMSRVGVLTGKTRLQGQISVALMLIAVLGMVSARYL